MFPLSILPLPLLALLATRLLFFGPDCTLAQTSQATCLSSFFWMDNSMGQSPCLVTAFLGTACYGGGYTVPALPSNSVYTGPYVAQQDQCQCSSVFYNTISACGLCQNHPIVNWSRWDFNCSTVYPGVFPLGIPSGTAVPQWAYQDVTASDMFNVTIAQSVGDAPESTATHVQSTGSVTTPSASASALLTTSSSSGSSSSSSDIGPIVGGVVGAVGLALLAGAGIAILSLARRKRRRIRVLAQLAEASVSPASPHTGSTAFVPQVVQPRFYNPSDPSTFPTSTGNTHSAVLARTAYTGLPEVHA